MPIPKNLKLADLLFYNPSNIDALTSEEIFSQLLETERIELIVSDLPSLQNSKLDWQVSAVIVSSIRGRLVANLSTNCLSLSVHLCLSLHQESVNNILLKFWELKKHPINKTHYNVKERTKIRKLFRKYDKLRLFRTDYYC